MSSWASLSVLWCDTKGSDVRDIKEFRVALLYLILFFVIKTLFAKAQSEEK